MDIVIISLNVTSSHHDISSHVELSNTHSLTHSFDSEDNVGTVTLRIDKMFNFTWSYNGNFVHLETSIFKVKLHNNCCYVCLSYSTAGTQCPMMHNVEDGTSTTSDLQKTPNSSKFFMLILNLLKMDQSTSTREEDYKDSSLDGRV